MSLLRIRMIVGGVTQGEVLGGRVKTDMRGVSTGKEVAGWSGHVRV